MCGDPEVVVDLGENDDERGGQTVVVGSGTQVSLYCEMGIVVCEVVGAPSAVG